MLIDIKRVSNLLVTICFSLFFIACSSDQKTWKIVRSNNDIISYEYYLENFPKGNSFDSANYFISKINILTGQRLSSMPPPLTPPIELWEHQIIDTICLQVSIYDDLRSKEFETRIQISYFDYFKETLAQSGITVVSERRNSKARMFIKLNILPLGAYYSDFIYKYTGYEVDGRISIQVDGQKPIILSISEKQACPETITTSGYQQMFNKIAKQDRKGPSYAMPDLKRGRFSDFIYKVWGLSPQIYLSSKTHIDLSLDQHKDKLDKHVANSIIRASYSNDISIRYRAFKIIESQNLRLEPDIILSIINLKLNHE